MEPGTRRCGAERTFWTVSVRGIASTGQVDVVVVILEAWTLNPSFGGTLPLTAARGVFVWCLIVRLSPKEGNFYCDLLLTTCFGRDKDGKPVRPSEVNANWQPTAAAPIGNFAGLFA
jgi:hypothetical protein